MRRCYEELVFPFFKQQIFPYIPRNALIAHLADYVKRTMDDSAQLVLQSAIDTGASLTSCVNHLDSHTKGVFQRLYYPVFIFRFLAPRLDENVTVSDHLLKSPFAIHKRTKAIALPMSGAKVRGFSPSNAITLASESSLIRETVSEAVQYLRDVMLLSRPLPRRYLCFMCTEPVKAPEDLYESMVYEHVEKLRKHFDSMHRDSRLVASDNTLELFIAYRCSNALDAEGARLLELRWRARLQDISLI